jgi:prepilin-type N-terminal cleavage/methylation domain-containing protein
MVYRHLNNNFSKKRGFTIVELLVVIVVIGILAAITIVSYTGIISKARDSSRAQAVESIQQMLEIYSIDNGGNYPACAGCTINGIASVLIPKYSSSLPDDPLSSTGQHIDYASNGDNEYTLLIDFEKKPNCRIITGFDDNWWYQYPAC